MPKQRKKRSKIWLISKEEFIKILDECNTIGEVLSRFNLRNVGSNYKTLLRRISEENIDYTKYKLNKHRGFYNRSLSLEEILVEKSKFSRHQLKKRLIQENIIEYLCSECHCIPEWNGKPLTLVLDHINGIPDDNRLENLRFLCPNCNSQTETFAGKNKKTVGG